MWLFKKKYTEGATYVRQTFPRIEQSIQIIHTRWMHQFRDEEYFGFWSIKNYQKYSKRIFFDFSEYFLVFSKSNSIINKF